LESAARSLRSARSTSRSPFAVGAIIGRTVTASSGSFATGAVALITLPAAHRLVAFARRHNRMARVIDHPPRVLVAEVKIQDRELGRAGLTPADVYAPLRQQGVDDLGQVGYLLYETPRHDDADRHRQ